MKMNGTDVTDFIYNGVHALSVNRNGATIFTAAVGLPAFTAEYRMDEGTGQILTDYSGHNYTGQLGSTTGADTNDPAWAGGGLKFATNDYCMIPIDSIDPDYDMTVYLCLSIPATPPAATEYHWSIGSGNTSGFCGMSSRTNGTLRLSVGSNSYSYYQYIEMVAADVVPGNRVLTYKRSGTTVTMKDIGSGKSIQVTGLTGFYPYEQMMLGASCEAAPANYSNQSIYYFVAVPLATTDPQDQLVYSYIKTKCAAKGVTVP